MIKVDLITGFLGSGKTTFLLKYARYLMKQGLRIGILEYDYGAVNVDMLLLNKLRCKQCEIEMVAAACDEDCLRRRFKTKLISMAMSGYDRIIIEPSGVFDMDMFFDTLRDDPLENWYEIGSVITIVNANLAGSMSKEEDYILASQAAGAGCILLSRTQLSSKEQIENTKSYILEAAKEIHCKELKGQFFEKNWDDLDEKDFQFLMNSGYHISSYMKVTAGKKSNFSSVCFIDLKDNLDQITDKIKAILSSDDLGNIVRIKGFVCDQGGGYQINATQYELLIDPIAIGQGILIIIGTDLEEEKIKSILSNK